MGLYKRGKVWWIAISHQGKQVRRPTGTANRKLAEAILAKVTVNIIEGRFFDTLEGKERTFTEMMERYLREHSAVNKAPLSHLRDKSLADHLLQFFGGVTISEIRPSLISEFKMMRRSEGAAPKTINNELVLMSHAFNLSIKEWEWVKENPVSKVSREKVDNLIERWLTLEEEEKLLAVSPKWLQEIIVFAINTGLRQSEILDMQWPQVNLFRKTVTLLKQKNKNKDTLPINKSALDILITRKRCKHPGPMHVFYNGKGKRIDQRNLLRAFYCAIKKAKVPKLRFHDLRHTFATRLVQAGVDLYTVQKLGRWKTISMVMRYAHHHIESLRSGIETLDKVREKPITILSQSNKKGSGQIGLTP